MTAAAPAPAVMPPAMSSGHDFLTEATALGEQALVPGVVPITPVQRLALRANAPLEPKKPQRPADHGLFDIVSRTQIEMF